MPALREDGQLIRGKRVAKPGQVFFRQQEIVLIDNHANAGVGAQSGLICL